MQIRLVSRQLSNFRLFPMLIPAHAHPYYLRKSLWATGIATSLLAFSACKKNTPLDAKNETHADEQEQTAVSVEENNLGTKQSSLLATASKSPIHWQPWNSRVFKMLSKTIKPSLLLSDQAMNLKLWPCSSNSISRYPLAKSSTATISMY